MTDASDTPYVLLLRAPVLVCDTKRGLRVPCAVCVGGGKGKGEGKGMGPCCVREATPGGSCRCRMTMTMSIQGLDWDAPTMLRERHGW